MSVGQVIRQLRKEKNMSQADLAYATGLSKGAISMYELDERRPKIETLEVLADCHQYLGGEMYRNAPREPFPFGKDLTAYCLRHEYCTELARKGIDIRITQRLMGHASPEMTLKVYTNLNQEDLDTEDVRRVINNFPHLQDKNSGIK